MDCSARDLKTYPLGNLEVGEGRNAVKAIFCIFPKRSLGAAVPCQHTSATAVSHGKFS